MLEFLGAVTKIINVTSFGQLSIIFFFNKHKHHEGQAPTVLISL